MAEDDFGAHDDYQRELDEEAEFEQQRADAERRNAAENVAGITVLQEGMNLHWYRTKDKATPDACRGFFFWLTCIQSC